MPYNNELKGVLFKNDKRDNPKSPHWTGNAVIEGKDYRVVCWDNVSKKGDNYRSLSFEEKKPQEQKSTLEKTKEVFPKATHFKPGVDDTERIDDDIPF